VLVVLVVQLGGSPCKCLSVGAVWSLQLHGLGGRDFQVMCEPHALHSQWGRGWLHCCSIAALAAECELVAALLHLKSLRGRRLRRPSRYHVQPVMHSSQPAGG
jgi:hypothetical protein